MTKTQLRAKIKGCMKTDKALIESKIQKAIDSGCMDIEGAEDNYRLAKTVLSAVYKEMSRQYEPLTKEGKKESENIYRHI